MVWLAIGAVGALGAAVTAAVQIWLARIDAKRQAAFTHIRQVEERLQRVWHISVVKARIEALAFYRGEVDGLTSAAADYLAYLTALDLLVFACERNAVDRNVAMTWLRGGLQRDDETLQFIIELQPACGDPSCFEYLKRHLGRAWQAAITIQPAASRTGS